MNSYKTILRFLIKDMFKSREKKQKFLIALLSVLYFCIAAMVVLTVISYSSFFLEQNKGAELITLILFADFIMTVIFGLISAISYLFISKDVEFFKTMPIKQSSIFLAKLTIVYLTEAALSAAILLPALITAGIFLSAPILFFCMIPLFIVVVPIFALVLIAILSLPLMQIISFFKNKGAAASVAIILVFVAFFSFYMVWAMSFSDISAEENANYGAILSLATVFSNAFYPVFMLAKFSLMTPAFGLGLPASMGVETAIFLGVFVASLAIAYLLCMAVYAKVTSRLLESGASKSVKNKKFVVVSPIKTLMKIEWRCIIRNPIVAMQVVSGVILCPLVVVLFCMMFTDMTATLGEALENSIDPANVIWIMGTMSILMFGAGLNSGPASCISREGKSINILKSLPLTVSDIIKAKKLTYFLIQFVSVLTGFAALITLMIIHNTFVWWMPPLCLAVVLVWLWAVVNISIYLDLKRPKLDWKSLKEVIKRVKNNVFSLVWIFSMMILGFVMLGFVITGALINVPAVIACALLALGVLGGVIALLFQSILKKNAEILFGSLNI